MSYNILKRKVNYVGKDTPEIKGTVDVSSDQVINGQKTFTDLSASSVSVENSIGYTGNGDTKVKFTEDKIQFMSSDSELMSVCGNDTPDTVKVQTGNLIVSNGKVGVGVTDPTFALEIDGDMSASGVFHNSGDASFGNDLRINGTFYGDGSGITGVSADIALASKLIGKINSSQISSSTGLTSDGDSLAVNLKHKGGLADQSGLIVDIGNSANQARFNNSHYILVSGSIIGNKNLALSVLERGLDLAASQISSGYLKNERMPQIISVQQLSASTTISGAYFEGDGSGLTGVKGAPIPAGNHGQIQFNSSGELATDSRLMFMADSNTLTAPNVSVSSRILASEYVGANGTVIDSSNNFTGNDALFKKVVASSEIKSSADIHALNFRGNGSTLNNIPMSSHGNSNIVFCDSTANTVTSNDSLRWSGTQIITLGLSASFGISGSSLHMQDSLNLGSNTLIDSNANTNFGQLTYRVDNKGNTKLPSENSKATFYIDEEADKFFVFVKYSDGTEKSGSIDLT